jgi:hypothetical protein
VAEVDAGVEVDDGVEVDVGAEVLAGAVAAPVAVASAEGSFRGISVLILFLANKGSERTHSDGSGN